MQLSNNSRRRATDTSNKWFVRVSNLLLEIDMKLTWNEKTRPNYLLLSGIFVLQFTFNCVIDMKKGWKIASEWNLQMNSEQVSYIETG